jgi:hypothetical protein
MALARALTASVQTKYSWQQAHGQQGLYQGHRVQLLGAVGILCETESLRKGRP